MKKLLIILLGTLILTPQNIIVGQSVFYYYKSNKIEIPCKNNCFNVYFDRNICPIDTMLAHYSVQGEIKEIDSTEYACLINYPSGTIQQAIEDLWNNPGVSGVEYVIGKGEVSVPVTKLFLCSIIHRR